MMATVPFGRVLPVIFLNLSDVRKPTQDNSNNALNVSRDLDVKNNLELVIV